MAKIDKINRQKDKEHKWIKLKRSDMYHCNICGVVKKEKRYTQFQYHIIGANGYTSIAPNCNQLIK